MHELRRLLISILLTLAILEGSLKLADPLGIAVYYQDMGVLLSRVVPSQSGYDFASGVIDMQVYDATIMLSGERYTPSALATGCRIGVVGDSVTFGMGVNDGDTFTELFAQQYPANWVNYGKPAYNAGNILNEVNALEAHTDLLIYLAISNDHEADWRYSGARGVGYQSALQSYLWSFYNRGRSQGYTTRFEVTIAQIASNNVLMFVLRSNPQLAIYTGYGAIVLPTYTEHVSIADLHPNAEGHAQLFHYMRPYVARALYEYCGV